MRERYFRILFWIVLVACFVLAIMPVTIDTYTSDKSQHVFAFATLTALALLGYREANRFLILAGLAAFGALIELVQGLPIVGRHRDVADWAADMIAVVAVLFLAAAIRSLSNNRNSQV